MELNKRAIRFYSVFFVFLVVNSYAYGFFMYDLGKQECHRETLTDISIIPTNPPLTLECYKF